jgi:anthranilate synthase component 1
MTTLLGAPAVDCPTAPAHVARAEALGELGVGPVDIAVGFADQDEVMLVDGARIGGRRMTIVAAGAALRFVARRHRARCTDRAGRSVPMAPGRDPLARLVALLGAGHDDDPLARGLAGSVFGFMAYDAARGFERLPVRNIAADVPDYTFFLPRWIVAVDAETSEATAVAQEADAVEACRSLRELTRRLRRAVPQPPAPAGDPSRVVWASLTRAQYEDAVRRAKHEIVDGEVFQLLLAVQWRLHATVAPLELYRRLTRVNPSPFQFSYRGPDFAAVGASPEPMLTLDGGRATIRPLAGTRPRGATPHADAAAEADLRGSIKDCAEHRMLVDLARNDLGRVSSPGSVHVDELMGVERYSHVMHLVSNVTGEVAPSTPIDALIRAGFPAGTMTGTPKVRAMELIEEIEPVARGLYSGAVGLLGADDMQLYLNIRGVVQRGTSARVHAGAGIVYDSDPAAEYEECMAKLRAPLTALGADGLEPS